ncbi:MFS transporter [Siphonobacter sp. SORGH_AS_0500]|uniref:MFS transporter n=1 Tax=Siphonobacter sp. SORGH_AS_0500 TaxID=1864824 RepID=UPI0028596E80|nr:MFS transporter [Siphonobacter sp. SORGH_AS_0500]MDR6197244.1 DHA3 family multidrug efflux protein-like MFS transporter [Siphonobacter sp. SORGH_AS_0500]
MNTIDEKKNYRIFYEIVVNSLAASLVNNFVWFALTFWVYLETKSVLTTSLMAGVYSGTVALTGFFLGTIVDRYPKKKSMLFSSLGSLVLYTAAFLLYSITPLAVFKNVQSPALWIFVLLALVGALAGNLRAIALSTLVSVLLPEEERDKANGLVGTANGVSFLVASIFSGLAIGYLGMFWMLVVALGLTVLVLIHLVFRKIPEKTIQHSEEHAPSFDVRKTIAIINAIPGLFGLIFFNCFNNFLGGVFMALMDPYGLSLVSVQVWGLLWGLLSLGFILGGIAVARKGLGNNPLRTLFLTNIIMWAVCCVFTLHASIILLSIGLFVYMCLIPVIEAAEQTIVQKVIPPEKQGRVFGFTQSIEQAASPVTALLIGPIAQYLFIPYMTTGDGIRWLGPWFGTGADRGIALIFTITGIIGLVITLLAMRSKPYHTLAKNYES